MRRLARFTRFVPAFAMVSFALGCRGSATAPNAKAFSAEGPFFIAGTITETRQPWGYRVDGQPGTSYRTSAAFFTVDSGTVLRHTDGSAASAAELTVGRSITLWITGAIAESFPPQVGARLIVLK